MASSVRKAGYSAASRISAIANATPTSSGVWTPRYIRENGTSRMTARQTQRTHLRRVMTAAAPKVLTAFCVWPDGKE